MERVESRKVALVLERRDAACFFAAPGSDGDKSFAYFIRFLETLSNECRAEPRFATDRDASSHGNLCRFLAYVGDVAKGAVALPGAHESCEPFRSKCSEYFAYLDAKRTELGVNPIGAWPNGLRFAAPDAEREKVLIAVVQETVEHLFDFYIERRVSPQPSVAPVLFIESADNSRKSRSYFYAGNETAIVETHYDCHLYVNLRNLAITPTILKTGWWEPWNDILLRSLLAPGMSFANAGANIGYHTVLGAKLVEHQGRVFAFEPNPATFALLEKGVAFNGFAERTTLYHAAVTDAAGAGSLYFVPGRRGGGGLRAQLENPADPKFASATKVASVTLNSTVGAALDTLDFLFMDIDGGEGAAILGGRDLIRRSRELRLILEWSASAVQPEIWRQYEAAAQFLNDEKFRFYRIMPPNGNVYATPPLLRRVEAQDLPHLPHCDLFLTRPRT